MIYGIIGELGKGKTLLLTCIAIQYHLKGKEIFSNYTLKFPHTRIKSVEHFKDIREGVVVVDEFGLICDANKWRTKQNEIIYDFLGRSRKRHLDLYYAFPHFFRIGKVARNLTNEILLPKVLEQTVNGEKIPYGMIVKVADKFGYIKKDKRLLVDCSTPVPELDNLPPYKLYYTDEEIDGYNTLCGVDDNGE